MAQYFNSPSLYGSCNIDEEDEQYESFIRHKDKRENKAK